MTAAQIVDLLGKKIFDSYLKFCIERDPVEKCISFYAMLRNSPYHYDMFVREHGLSRRRREEFSWEEYLAVGTFPVDHAQYSSGPKLLVDQILRYESLEDELTDLFRDLGVPWKGMTSKAKSGFRTESIITATMVTDRQRLQIMRAFAASNLITGYG